jgi:glutathione-regulated potassium-efflux system ancillary protein KefG
MNKILVLFAHPAIHKSRVNAKLLASIDQLVNVKVHQLYEEYPDFHIHVKREQELLLEHDLIIWQHPLYWYSSPSLLKEWIDLVLEHNFAYGHKGNALKGKTALSILTTGGQKQAYLKKNSQESIMKDLLIPFQRTTELCQMFYLPPFVIHGTHMLDNTGIEKATNQYQQLILSLREGQFSHEEVCRYDYLNKMINH